MGVRGLTTFIAKNSDRYMESYELKNTYLVIDGNNVAAQIYRWHAQCVDCFGGDYDQYAEIVKTFFKNLLLCQITPLVVFDGCYENKKLKTIYSRIRNRVQTIKKTNLMSEGTMQVFPLFLRELFTEVVLSLKIKAMRCEFEADYEMACLAKTINCPVLSYDSDFYIFDVLYIPFSTLNCEPKLSMDKDKHTYHFLECQIYKMDNFLNYFECVDRNVLPLLATVVGNDYIAAKLFNDFYAQLKFVKRRRGESEQQQRIESVIRWLLNETYDSAATKILSRIKRDSRQKLADQIEEVSNGYHCVKSTSLNYFGLDSTLAQNSSIEETKRKSQIDLTQIPDDYKDEEQSGLQEEEEEIDEKEVPGELNLEKLQGNFPEWFIYHYRSCNYPAWFMDMAVHNRYFFIPQLENYDKEHSHTISLDIVAAMHKILRPNSTELTYISRQGNNFARNTRLPYSAKQLPTLQEIPSMSTEEGQKHLLNILDMADDTTILDFLKKFDGPWRLFVLAILFWAERVKSVNKVHIYSLILCAVTLNKVDKQVGYIRSSKELNKKFKKIPAQFEPYLNHVSAFYTFFSRDSNMMHNPNRSYDIFVVDAFSRFQSVLFHIKYINKLLLNPFEDFMISDFYNGTFVYKILMLLKKRVDPLSCLKERSAKSMDIFNQFLQIAIEITCRLEALNEGAKKPKKRKTRMSSKTNSEEAENEKNEIGHQDQATTSSDNEYTMRHDPNNPYSVLTMQ